MKPNRFIVQFILLVGVTVITALLSIQLIIEL